MAEGSCGKEEAVLRQSFVSALRKKYSCDEPLSIQIFVPKSAPGQTECGELIVPNHLALNYSSVAEAGLMSEIADVIAKVTELDLSMNLLSQWSEVFKIISFIPRIHFLNVSNNPLNLSDDVEWTAVSFPEIKQLVLNAVGVSWNTVWNLLSAMPQIEELHLSLNGFLSVEYAVDCAFPRVTSLHMNGNSISRWAEMESLGKVFPGLANLVMMDMPMCELTGERPDANFCCLKSLNLGNTNLSSWTELEKLKSFPCLTDVKVHGIPFLEKYEAKLRRSLTIGYLPNVERLNGSPVFQTEREDAERIFIRHYLDAEDKPTRYDELVTIHGHLEPLVTVDLSAKNTVSVMVHYLDKSKLRRFNIHSTAFDVKKLLAKELVCQPPRAFNLYHQAVGALGHEIMRFPQRTLLCYRVNDGDEFYVELKQD